jgi:hypothetical protein
MIFGCILNFGCKNQQTTTAQNNNKQQTFDNADDAAKSALNVLQTLAADKNLSGAISLTADETKQLTVGKALNVQEVSYDKLLSVNPDSSFDVATIMQPGQQHLLYPLEINGSPKTTALVSMTDNRWKLSSAGDNSYMELLTSKQIMQDSGVQIVDVPGMHIRFITYTENGRKFYISDSDVPESKIEKGQPMEEQQALHALASYAQIFNSKYGDQIKQKKVLD